MTDKTSERPYWAPEGVDTTKPSSARVYDYYLGGTYNFAVDRELGDQVIALLPETPEIMRANRAFLRRAVEHLAERGVRQFIDLGSGIPGVDNVHEVSRRVAPDCRVLYVDSDDLAVAHSQAILADVEGTAVLQADVADPGAVLDSAELPQLVDLRQPVALLLASVLQFVPDEAEPDGIVATYRDAIPQGSYLALSHATADGMRDTDAEVSALYQRGGTPIRYRTHDDVRGFFDGFELLPPGLVHLERWRPGFAADVEGPLHGAAGLGCKR